MLETVYGQTKNRVVADQLNEVIEKMGLNGTFYIGYPVLASADEKIEVDGLLLTLEHGLIAFLIESSPPIESDNDNWQKLENNQNRLYFAIENNLSKHESLRVGRKLGVNVETVTVFPVDPQTPNELEGNYTGLNGLSETVEKFSHIDEKYFRHLEAALQRVTTIKPPKKRSNVQNDSSRGAILKKIEKEIANLDQWQKKAAIETPDGPQRIRGLAGSGKTVVLALKAAYLHAQHPEWEIAVTFHSRSLYQQLKDLIRRFSFEHLSDEPNWEKLRILHSWGGRDRNGIYTEIAEHGGLPARDFLYGKTRFGMDNAFQGICGEMLSTTTEWKGEPLYDVVLIDEAQDLPKEFFKLVYRFTSDPKRIIWAYDELQKISESVMPATEDLFGYDEQGSPLVTLSNDEGRPREDIILPICYRNTPWALTLAHALGFGIFRNGGIVQHFDDPSLWTEIGYRIVDGNLELGQKVTLERKRSTYPDFFTELLQKNDAIVCKSFSNEIEQIEWISEQIRLNLNRDELQADDILIILPDAYSAKNTATRFIKALSRHSIEAHLAGVSTSKDKIFSKNSVALANIYRSKGNEASMVYLANSQHCYSGYELITLRNTLFTSITRCRAWVRVCGWGPEMDKLLTEISCVVKNDYKLSFTIPTLDELKQLRMIHRDRTTDEKARIKKAENGINEFFKVIDSGELDVDTLPEEIREKLLGLIKNKRSQNR